MTPTKAGKVSLDKFGYGMLGLYAALVMLGALGVYGWTFTSVFSGFSSSSDRVRAQLQSGRMLIATEDRVHCRSYTFNNDTAHMTTSGVTDCENRLRKGGGAVGGSFGIIRDSFNNR
jgi:hypothetical protein